MHVFEELSHDNQADVRTLILAGLEERWGTLDPTLNPDLDDMMSTYGHGRTVVARNESGDIVGTGTIVPQSPTVAEILRMSVASQARRHGLGGAMVEELVATARQWGAVSVVLETSTAWTDAVTFYKNTGFVVTKTDDAGFDPSTYFTRHLRT